MNDDQHGLFKWGGERKHCVQMRHTSSTGRGSRRSKDTATRREKERKRKNEQQENSLGPPQDPVIFRSNYKESCFWWNKEQSNKGTGPRVTAPHNLYDLRSKGKMNLWFFFLISFRTIQKTKKAQPWCLIQQNFSKISRLFAAPILLPAVLVDKKATDVNCSINQFYSLCIHSLTGIFWSVRGSGSQSAPRDHKRAESLKQILDGTLRTEENVPSRQLEFQSKVRRSVSIIGLEYQ